MSQGNFIKKNSLKQCYCIMRKQIQKSCIYPKNGSCDIKIHLKTRLLDVVLVQNYSIYVYIFFS